MSKKSENHLVGSAGSLEALLGAIAQYFGAADIRFVEREPGTFEIHNALGKLESVQVRRVGRRYRFERIQDVQS